MFYFFKNFVFRDFSLFYHKLSYFKFNLISCIKVLVSVPVANELEIIYFFLYFEFIFNQRPLIYKMNNSTVHIVLHFNNLLDIYRFFYVVSFLFKFSRIRGCIKKNSENCFIFWFQDISKLPLISLDFFSSEIFINFSFFFSLGKEFDIYYKSFFKLLN